MNKRLYCRLLSCFVLLNLFISAIISPAYAKEIDALLSNTTETIQLEILEDEPKKQVIDVFDVRDDGWFVVGLNTQEICVYDQNGIYQYGFRIHINGMFSVELLAETVIIYLVRGNTAIYLDKDGVCVSCVEVKPQYISQMLNRSKKQIQDDFYILERDIGIFRGDYARLVKISQTDGQTVLYDATSIGLAVGMWHYIVVIGIAACLIFAGGFVWGQGDGSKPLKK